MTTDLFSQTYEVAYQVLSEQSDSWLIAVEAKEIALFLSETKGNWWKASENNKPPALRAVSI